LRTTPAGFEGRAVNGGYVYRGPDPDMQGLYFFSDSQVKNVWTIDSNDLANADDNVDNVETELGSLYASSVNNMVSFGEDAVGNVYIVDYTNASFQSNTGEVYRIVTNNLLAGDYDADGKVDDADFAVWKSNFGATAGGGLAADGNGNNIVDAADYTVWRNNFGNSAHNLGAGSGGTSVPEPTTALLLGQLMVLQLLRWTRRARL
jgi:hypothetical protein